MCYKKDINSKEKQDIVQLLTDWNSMLEITKILKRDQKTKKKENGKH